MWPFRKEIAAVSVQEQRSLADPTTWELELFGAVTTLSGASVTPATAMRCTPVRACVEGIAETVGGFPVHIYHRDGDARERATDHPAYALLHDQANEWTPSALFVEQLTRDALLHGNGYAFINRGSDGKPRELIRLRPDAMSVEVDTITGEPAYKLSETAGQRIISRRDILHIQAPSIDGVKGASPIHQCREAIALAITIQEHAARLFGRGAKPSGVLTHPGKLGAESGKRMLASWRAAHSGENAGGTALLEEGTKFERMALTSVESQTLELWQFTVIEICRVFRVPPHLVFELGRATWGNAGEMGASFLRFTLMRWIKVWEGEIRLKLIDPADRHEFYPEFLVDDLLRADLAARAEAYAKLISARVLNPNEARAMENRAPYPGGEVFANPNTSSSSAPKEGKADA